MDKNKFGNKYEVEKVLGIQLVDEHHYYLVKWKNFPESEATWESEKDVPKSICKEFIQALDISFKGNPIIVNCK